MAIILTLGKFILNYFCPCYDFLAHWLSVRLPSAFAKFRYYSSKMCVFCLDIHCPGYFFAPVVIFCFLQLNFVICLFWVFFLFFLSLAVRGYFRHGGFFFSRLILVLASVQTAFRVPKSSITEANQQPFFQFWDGEGLIWNIVLSLSLLWGGGETKENHISQYRFIVSKICYVKMNVLSCWRQLYDIFLFLLDFRLLIGLPIANTFCLTNFSESVFKV